MRTKEKHREYNCQYYRQRREKFIQQLGGKCAICGSTEQLEFDHIDKTSKKAGIARMMTCNSEDVQAELSKCQLLCKQCHITKSKEHKDIHAKISLQEALAIRSDYVNTKLTQTALGKKYKLSQTEIGMILRGERWKESVAISALQNEIDAKRASQEAWRVRAIDQLDIKTGNILRTYMSLADAKRSGFKASAIAKCCQGKFVQHHGYKWQYHNTNN